jgi:hypothetical protein
VEGGVCGSEVVESEEVLEGVVSGEW